MSGKQNPENMQYFSHSCHPKSAHAQNRRLQSKRDVLTFVRMRNSRTTYFVLVRYGLGVWPDGKALAAAEELSVHSARASAQCH